MNEQEIKTVVAQVVARLTAEPAPSVSSAPEGILVEASARHVHLTAQAVETLFGKGATLTPKRALSQPGEFLSHQRVKLVTTKGEIANVAVLGPERPAVQAEISLTDARVLGLNVPVNLSGNLQGAADVCMVGDKGMLYAPQSVIAAQAHIHMAPGDAARFGVADGQVVRVAVQGKRPLTFDHVVVRISPSFALAMHIDFDEANACCLTADTRGILIKG